jgi:hypothetical protein
LLLLVLRMLCWHPQAERSSSSLQAELQQLQAVSGATAVQQLQAVSGATAVQQLQGREDSGGALLAELVEAKLQLAQGEMELQGLRRQLGREQRRHGEVCAQLRSVQSAAADPWLLGHL